MAAQHPVPQHISSYEFRLVGDMTLKQFFQVAGGALVALVFYAAPLPTIIKWPVVLLSALSGVAMAFLPIEERPLDRWLVAFLKAVYSPTRYVWQKGVEFDLFAPEEAAKAPEVAIPTTSPEQAREYLTTIPREGGRILSAFEKAEETFFEKVAQLFSQVTAPAPPKVVPTPAPATQTRPRFVVEEEGLTGPAAQQVTQQAAAEPVPAPAAPTPVPIKPVKPTLTGDRMGKARAARFEPSAAPPVTPEAPNVVVGQVLTSEGKIVEGAILEIRDEQGRPVRALKTNKVGHFSIVTPLKSGVYEIETEKEGMSFEVIKFEAAGQIIPPIEILAKPGKEGEQNANA